MPSTINLNREFHIYTLGDKVIPSVTQTLKDQGIFTLSPFSTGPERGTQVHAACEAIDLGFFDSSAYPQEVLPFVEAYRAFKVAVNFEPKHIEQIVYNEQYGYAGMLDRLGLLNGKPALVDIKTGVPHFATVIQVAAYWGALNNGKTTCYSLYLKADGKYKLNKIKPADLFAAWNTFLAALSVYKFRQTNNLLD
jgi:hypothetical protein